MCRLSRILVFNDTPLALITRYHHLASFRNKFDFKQYIKHAILADHEKAPEGYEYFRLRGCM